MAAGTVELALIAAAAGIGTYAWRGLGVLLSGRIDVESELFRWVACVAYAMLAGLIARIIVMPTGILATTALPERVIACLLALAVYRAASRNLFAAVATGLTVLIAAGMLRGI